MKTTITIDSVEFNNLCAANGRLRTKHGINGNGRRTSQSVDKDRKLSTEEREGLALEAAIKLIKSLGSRHGVDIATEKDAAQVAPPAKPAKGKGKVQTASELAESLAIA